METLDRIRSDSTGQEHKKRAQTIPACALIHALALLRNIVAPVTVRATIRFFTQNPVLSEAQAESKYLTNTQSYFALYFLFKTTTINSVNWTKATHVDSNHAIHRQKHPNQGSRQHCPRAGQRVVPFRFQANILRTWQNPQN